MAKISEDGRKADFGVGPSWLFAFIFESGSGRKLHCSSGGA